MTEHLGYDRHDPAGRGSGNSCNGVRSKTVLTEIGPVDIDVPRDVRLLVRSADRQEAPERRVTGIDEIVLSLTAMGLTTVSDRSPTGPVYVAIGVTCGGERDILGLWASDGGEGVKFWLSVLTEIKNRGTGDVCIVVCDAGSRDYPKPSPRCGTAPSCRRA